MIQTTLVRLTGASMIIELKRVLTMPLDKRPLMTIKTSDPEWAGGMAWEGVSISSFSTTLDENEKITGVGVGMTQAELGNRYYGWHPDGSNAPKDEYEAEWLEVYYAPGRERVGIGSEALERFLAMLPQPADPELVAQQRELEKTLPRVQSDPETKPRGFRV